VTKNRDIQASKGVPLENMVISEIPVNKAISIGRLKPKENSNEKG
jgi:hypothetical protein